MDELKKRFAAADAVVVRLRGVAPEARDPQKMRNAVEAASAAAAAYMEHLRQELAAVMSRDTAYNIALGR